MVEYCKMVIKYSFFLIFIGLLSCDNNNYKDKIYYEMSFVESLQISKELSLPFCMIVYDTLQVTAQEYLRRLYSNEKSLEKCIFNFVSINNAENRWYEKILLSEVYPVACVFDLSGKLLDLIPGSSKESMSYLREVIATIEANTVYHYNQKYGKEKLETIRQIDNIINLKFKVDDEINVVNEINVLLKDVCYPYILFLKLKNQLQFNDTVAAIATAKDLLKFDSAEDLLVYNDELMFANKIIDPDYDIETGPMIELDETLLNLHDCKVGRTLQLPINIVNKGKRPLKVSDILMSCSCLKLTGPTKYLISPNRSVTIKIEFTPDISGNIFREVYIASNAVNTPISTIEINAFAID